MDYVRHDIISFLTRNMIHSLAPFTRSTGLSTRLTPLIDAANSHSTSVDDTRERGL